MLIYLWELSKKDGSLSLQNLSQRKFDMVWVAKTGKVQAIVQRYDPNNFELTIFIILFYVSVVACVLTADYHFNLFP